MDAYKPEIEAELLANEAPGVSQQTLDTLWESLMDGFQLRANAR